MERSTAAVAAAGVTLAAGLLFKCGQSWQDGSGGGPDRLSEEAQREAAPALACPAAPAAGVPCLPTKQTVPILR